MPPPTGTPQIFLEQSFALYEINLYIRILAIAQPKSILQWQMTADYSLLAGGGIFGDNGPLRPTQRFWNLKQLASTPPRSFALPVQCKSPASPAPHSATSPRAPTRCTS